MILVLWRYDKELFNKEAVENKIEKQNPPLLYLTGEWCLKGEEPKYEHNCMAQYTMHGERTERVYYTVLITSL